jgi:hypothetical protein
MPFLRPRIRRLLQLDTWRGRDATRDLLDEMELHIALRAEQLERAGMAAHEARREAQRLFALSESTLDDLHAAALDRNRHMRSRQQWEAIWQDTRYAARRLVRERGTTSFILATLALGIGINVTAFSIVDRVLLRGPACAPLKELPRTPSGRGWSEVAHRHRCDGSWRTATVCSISLALGHEWAGSLVQTRISPQWW